MAGRRARTGRGWDAGVPRPPRPARAAGDRRADGVPERWAAGGGDSGAADSDADPRSAGGGRDRGAGRSLPWSTADRGAERTTPERDEPSLAREICLRQLAVRPRTRAELSTALRKRGISDEVIAEVLDRYDEVGIIDDAAFARAWVSSRHHGKGLAGRALAQELRRRGVDQELISEAVAELDPQTEEATALDVARRKLRGMSGDPESVFRRLVGALARKGYSGGVAVRAVKQAVAERSAEDAQLMELVDPDAITED